MCHVTELVYMCGNKFKNDSGVDVQKKKKTLNHSIILQIANLRTF